MPTKYNIPKKRKTIKTIKINNGSLTFDTDDNGKGYWFRNGKYILRQINLNLIIFMMNL